MEKSKMKVSRLEVVIWDQIIVEERDLTVIKKKKKKRRKKVTQNGFNIKLVNCIKHLNRCFINRMKVIVNLKLEWNAMKSRERTKRKQMIIKQKNISPLVD